MTKLGCGPWEWVAEAEWRRNHWKCRAQEYYPVGLLLNLFNKYLLSIYYVPGTVLGTEDTAVDMAESLNSWGFRSWGETGHTQANKHINNFREW